MTDEDKKRIAEYMGWTTEPYWWCEKCKEEKSPYHVTYNTNCSDCGCAVVIKEDHPFDSNDASLCVTEMQKRGDWGVFINHTWSKWSAQWRDLQALYEFVFHLFNAENFFKAFVEWRKK